MAERTIEVYFDFKSSYSHLMAQTFPKLAAARDARIRWMPVQFDDVYAKHGVPVPHPWPGKMRQVYFDLKRRAKRFGVPFKLPSTFPTYTTPALCVARLAAREGFGTELIQAMFMAYYGGRDLDLGKREVVEHVLNELGADGAAFYERAQLERDAMREDAERAAELGVIGAPSFRVGRDVFWGSDRMEDALDQLDELARG